MTTLCVRGLGSVGMPKEIGKLVNLTELYLRSSDLSELPDEFGQLTQLEVLHIPNNQLTALPASLQIEILTPDMEHNRLPSFQCSLSLTQLMMLDICENAISTIPDTIQSLQTDLTQSVRSSHTETTKSELALTPNCNIHG